VYVGLLLARKAAGQFLGTGLSLLTGRVAQGLCAHHHPLPIKSSTPASAWPGRAAGPLPNRAGVKGVKVLGCPVDDLLDLRLAQAYAGFRLDVGDDFFKGPLHRFGRHALLQPMRVAPGRQVQLGIAGKRLATPRWLFSVLNDIEAYLEDDGRELLRLLLQDHSGLTTAPSA